MKRGTTNRSLLLESILSILFLMFASFSFAQNAPIKGKVVDATSGKPISGASVLIKGTQRGTTTNDEGDFSLNTPPTATLVFSSVGYTTTEERVNGRANITVALSLAVASDLNEVVIIGYGTTTKKDMTGSIATAPISDMSKAPVGSFAEALQGRIAGVAISSPSAQPGANSNIVIRGNNSITQANSPLYVVDGFPLENFDMNSISPDDIASIDILKDASATAIYGARGANGVIIITTKIGKTGPPVVSFDASYGFQDILKRMKLMDPYDFVKYQLEVSPGDVTIPGSAPYLYLQDGDLDSYKDTANLNWQDRLFKRAPIQNYNIGLRGGSDRTKYSISGNIFDQQGVIINSGYKRYVGRARIDEKISEKVKVGLNTSYSYMFQNGISPAFASQSGGSATASMMYSIWGFRPFGQNLLENLYDDNINSANDYRFNPLLDQQNIVRTNSWNVLNANAFLDYSITSKLSLRVTGGVYSNIRESVAFNDTLTHFGNNKISSDGINGSDAFIRTTSWVNENTLTYNTTINRVHRINAVAGFTQQQQMVKTSGVRATHLPDQATGVNWLGTGTPFSIQSGETYNRLASFLGRVNYSYQSKYLATVAFRADGASKFAPENHWSYFPSGALAWRFGDENFVKNSKVISGGKLRASYGVTGNNRVGDFSYLSQFNTFPNMRGYVLGGTPISGLIPNILGNRNLKWERTSQTDLGLDLALFKSRIELTLDFYYKKTTDLLLNAQLPASYGYSNMLQNIGSVDNKGVELTLSTINVDNKDFRWTSNFNISFNRNKVLQLAENQHAISNLFAPFDNTISTVPAFVAIVGQEMGLMYGPVWDGVYQYNDFDKVGNGYVLKNTIPTNGNPRATIQPGDIKYKDLNGDGVVDNNDFTILGRGLPRHTGGFTNNFFYKGFELDVFFEWSYGNDMLNANRLVFEGNMLAKTGLNQFATYENRWTPDNQNNEYFRTGGQGPRANMFSSRILEDGSYLRLKTVSLSYNFPKNMIKNLSMKNLNLYVAAQNLVTWTNYSGMDPEVSIYNNVLTPGVDFSSYPRARIITFGLKATF